MSQSTQAELEGVPYGAVGFPSPYALQSALDKLRKPKAYATLADAKASLVKNEAALVTVNNVPSLLYRNPAGNYFGVNLTAV